VYYVLECYGPDEEDRAALGRILNNVEESWRLGRRFKSPPTAPIEVELDPNELPGLLMPLFDRGILLMTDAMIEAIRASGVDNLDVYDAVLIDPIENVRHGNYKAVNVIGLVAAADLGKSKWKATSGEPLIDADFDSLAIDEAKTQGALMFRLAECVSAIVIHQRVKQSLEGAGIQYLDFVDPAKWIG
jgi:hypothetical protein